MSYSGSCKKFAKVRHLPARAGAITPLGVTGWVSDDGLEGTYSFSPTATPLAKLELLTNGGSSICNVLLFFFYSILINDMKKMEHLGLGRNWLLFLFVFLRDAHETWCIPLSTALNGKGSDFGTSEYRERMRVLMLQKNEMGGGVSNNGIWCEHDFVFEGVWPVLSSLGEESKCSFTNDLFTVTPTK